MKVAIVSGALANKCLNGGEAWVRLSWIGGLRKLGFDTYFIEHIQSGHCSDERGQPTEFYRSQNLQYFCDVADDFGLVGKSGLICDRGLQHYGIGTDELSGLARSAELLINISGHLPLDLLQPLGCRKVWIDIDPGFTQCWHDQGNTNAQVMGHDYYFTIGENIGTPECSIPTCGIHWRHTRQPVVVEDWPVAGAPSQGRFTTIGSWRGPFGPVTHLGKTYGLKVHEFRKMAELPKRVDAMFEIALNIHSADQKDRELMQQCGWRIVDPQTVAADPGMFQMYVQNSLAEFSVAQGIYVETNSGWFSDRTVRYLASGKPVLVQETGFRRNLPVGKGLVSFRNLEEAIRGAELILTDLDQQRAAARRIAEDYFDSDLVLGRMLDEIGITP